MNKVFPVGESLCLVLFDAVICVLAGSEHEQRKCLELADEYAKHLDYTWGLPDGRDILVFTR